MKLETPLSLDRRRPAHANSLARAAAPVDVPVDMLVEVEETAPSFVSEAAQGNVSLELRELWEYRELLYFLVWRDIKVRYKQTALGVAWAVFQPLLTTLAFTIFFGNLGRMPSNGIPYALFAFAALLPWQLFTYSLTAASTSLVLNGHLLTKVFFPRLLVPLAAIFVGLVDFCVSCLVLVGMLLYFQVVPTWAFLSLPFFVLLALGTALAVSLWLAPLCVRYRDIQIIIPFLAQFWLFVTPVAYPTSIVPAQWQPVYALNPMVAVIEGFRWALLGQTEPLGMLVAIGTTVTLVLLISGLVYFRQAEAAFADVI